MCAVQLDPLFHFPVYSKDKYVSLSLLLSSPLLCAGTAVQRVGPGVTDRATTVDKMFHSSLTKADAIFTWEPTDTVYAFRGGKVIIYNKGTREIEEVPIGDVFSAFAKYPISDIDAAFSDVGAGTVTFFKGDVVYELGKAGLNAFLFRKGMQQQLTEHTSPSQTSKVVLRSEQVPFLSSSQESLAT